MFKTLVRLQTLLRRRLQGRADALRREASFQLLFNGNPIPMWVYDVETLQFLAVNEAAISRYGYSREQFLAMTALDIRPGANADRSDFVHTSGGRHVGEQIWQHQVANGEKIDVATYASALNYEGRSAALVAAIDVTDRVRAEDGGRQTKTFLRSVIENMPIMVSVKNADDGRYVLINRACEKVLGLPAAEIVGKHMQDLVPSDAELVQSNDVAVYETGETVTYEHRMQSIDGERLLSVKKLPIWGTKGNPQYASSQSPRT